MDHDGMRPAKSAASEPTAGREADLLYGKSGAIANRKRTAGRSTRPAPSTAHSSGGVRCAARARSPPLPETVARFAAQSRVCLCRGQFLIFALHFVQDDGVPRSIAADEGDVVLTGPAPQAKFFHRISMERLGIRHRGTLVLWIEASSSPAAPQEAGCFAD